MKKLNMFVLLFLMIQMPSSFSALLAQTFARTPDGPASATNSEFPVHVRILVSHWNRVNGGYQGYGRGDILGDKPSGFDYNYSCGEPFLHNAQKGEFYQARWKKENQKLEILMQEMGSNHEQKCELKVAVKSEPYEHYGANAGAPSVPAPSAAQPPATPQ